MSEPPRKKKVVQSKLSLIGPPQPPQEDRHEDDDTTRKRKITSVPQPYEETLSSTEQSDGSCPPEMSIPLASSSTAVPDSGEGRSPFSVWTDEMWASKKETNPWIDFKDGKLGCKVCSSVMDFSAFNERERRRLSEHDWRFYTITDGGKAKSNILANLARKILKHRRSDGHVSAQHIEDDPKRYPTDDRLQKDMCALYAYQYGLVSCSQHAAMCKLCRYIVSVRTSVLSKLSLTGLPVSVSVPVGDLEDRNEDDDPTGKRNITSVLQPYEETVSSSTEQRDGSCPPEMSIPLASSSTAVPDSGEGRSPFSVWTDEMWASKKETNPWIDCKDGKLGCKVCSSVMDFSAFNERERKEISERDWRYYTITPRGKDKRAILANLGRKIRKHEQSEAHDAAEAIRDDPEMFPVLFMSCLIHRDGEYTCLSGHFGIW